MAEDTRKISDTQKVSQQDIQDALEKQVAELKREITKINKTLAGRAEEAAEAASGWYDAASDRASRAAQQLRSRAQTVSETVKENRGTVSASLLVGGLLGLLVGMALSNSENHHSQRWW